MKKFKIFNKIKSPDELEALVDIAGNLYLCIKDKQINSATDFIKELNICGAQAIFDYVLGTVADVSIDKAVQKIRKIIPNFLYKKSHIGEQQDANAPPQISANTETKALPEAKQQLLLPEKISHLKHKIVDFPNLNKELDKLGDLKEQFFKDFDELADDKIILFEQNTKLVDAWKRFAECKAPDELRKNIGAIEALAIDIKTNVRPDPSTYLSKEYIEAHMKKFKDGAAFIITEADYTSHPNIGHDSKFVSNVESIEKVVREAKIKFKVQTDNEKEIEIATKKTIGYIEEKLGLEKGRLGNNLNEICIIYLKPEQIRNPRIPDGNASGTNRFWIPGGCTASEDAMGIPEIVIDCSHLSRKLFDSEYNNKISLTDIY